MKTYRTLTRCYHTREDRLIPPGQPIDLSHLTPDEIMLLETMTPPAVEAVDAAEAQPAPANGQEE